MQGPGRHNGGGAPLRGPAGFPDSGAGGGKAGDIAPAQVLQALAKELPAENVRLQVQTDITLDGLFGEEWLIVTSRHLAVCSRTDSEWRVGWRRPLGRIEGVEVRDAVGSGIIEVRGPDGCQRIAAFSPGRNKTFHEAAARIRQWIGPTPAESAADREPSKPAEPPSGRLGKLIKKTRAFARLIRFSRPHAWRLGLVFALMLLGTGFGLAAPYLSKLFIDVILKPDPATGLFPHGHWLPWAALALLVAHAGQIGFGAFQEWLLGTVGHRTLYDIRAELYGKLQELSLSFFDKHQTGSLAARVNQDTGELQELLVDFLPLLLESALTLVGVGVLLLTLNARLTAIALVPVMGVAVFARVVFPRVHVYYDRYYHRRAQLGALVNDSFSGMRVVKAFRQEEAEIGKFERKSGALRDMGLRLTAQWSIIHPAFHSLIILGGILVWIVGGRFVLAGGMTIGSVVAFSGYLAMFFRPVFILIRMAQMMVRALSAGERVVEILDAQPEVRDSPDAVPVAEIKGSIELRNVRFGYDKHRPVIKGISLAIGPGEMVGLVGRSGAGKSTIINLICRLYDPDEGAVLLDGIDMRRLRHCDLRRQIGVVLQDTFLFNGTIYENIAYARPDASREEVVEAAMAAYAHEFIMERPDAYDTEVGERGSRLSGGEKQRLAIARAVLRNPRILILDEATSSVDTETECKIQKALENLTRNRTTVAIAHRLSTLRNCSRIFVIQDGAVAESGTHQELLERKGLFHELVQAQRKLSEIVEVGK